MLWMKHRSRVLRGSTLGLLTVALMTPAVAHAGQRRIPRPDVDFDRLRARLACTPGGWRLRIDYEIETEDASPGRLDLVLRLTHRGRTLRDRTGQPIEYLIPLDTPSEIDDDELEFRGRIDDRLPRHLLRGARRVKIEALVFDRHRGRVIETKRVSVKRR